MQQWTNKEVDRVINLLKEGKNYVEISEILNRDCNSIRVKMQKIGEGYFKYNPPKPKYCINCGNEIKTKEGKKFCSRSCSATYNNLGKVRSKKTKKKCLNCDEFTNNPKYCCIKCQSEYSKKIKYKRIEEGDETLYYWHYRSYLIDKYGAKCMDCGWCEVNPYTGKVPIELEHIDGDSSNNKLSNLKLLCPNCHSLTGTYKALNKGNGRYERMERYKEGKSF